MEENITSKTGEMENSKVSIIITTYKRPSYLGRAIESCLTQSYENVEVIVVDDNSEGSRGRLETEKQMEKYKDFKEVKYIKHKLNSNGAVARNTGIMNSDGYYITYLDDDDFYHHEKIEKQVNYLRTSGYDAVYCGWTREGRVYLPKKEGDLSFEILSGSQLVYTNSILIKRNTSMSFGNWDETFSRNQEAAYLMRYFDHNLEIGVVSESLVNFDTSDRSNASDPAKNQIDFEYFLQYHERQIKIIKDDNPLNGKLIYVYRYRGVLLNYLKGRDFKRAFAVYIKYCMEYPILFNKELTRYVLLKISKKDTFNEV